MATFPPIPRTLRRTSLVWDPIRPALSLPSCTAVQSLWFVFRSPPLAFFPAADLSLTGRLTEMFSESCRDFSVSTPIQKARRSTL